MSSKPFERQTVQTLPDPSKAAKTPGEDMLVESIRKRRVEAGPVKGSDNPRPESPPAATGRTGKGPDIPSVKNAAEEVDTACSFVKPDGTPCAAKAKHDVGLPDGSTIKRCHWHKALSKFPPADTVEKAREPAGDDKPTEPEGAGVLDREAARGGPQAGSTWNGETWSGEEYEPKEGQARMPDGTPLVRVKEGFTLLTPWGEPRLRAGSDLPVDDPLLSWELRDGRVWTEMHKLAPTPAMEQVELDGELVQSENTRPTTNSNQRIHRYFERVGYDKIPFEPPSRRHFRERDRANRRAAEDRERIREIRNPKARGLSSGDMDAMKPLE